MKRLGITANCGKARAPEVLRRLSGMAASLRLELFADEETARLLPGATALPIEGMFDRVEAVVALGGDGTMLRTARALAGGDRPVMGINMGGLGFLTSVAEADMEEALQCLAQDRFSASENAVAACTVIRGGRDISNYRALNDVLVARGLSSRAVTLDVRMDGEDVTSYVCDGLIVSTPVGSTGHSLSAGGPILKPDTDVFVVSLLSPHTLSSRPLVIPSRCEVEIEATERSGDVRLTVDGQIEVPLEVGDVVKVKRSGQNVRFIHLPGYSYFGVLRKKLGWRGSNV